MGDEMAPAVTCECGVCGKCKRRVYMRQWYARPENTDRHRATSRASRDRRLAAVQAYDRKRGFRVYDAVKVAARRAVGHAVARGTITPGPCEVCGQKAEAHHDDYSEPLEVRWLCRPHHAQLHRKIA